MQRQTQHPQSWGLAGKKIQRSLTKVWSRRDTLSITGSYLLVRTWAPSTAGWAMRTHVEAQLLLGRQKSSEEPRSGTARIPPNNSLDLFFVHACTGKSWRISFHSLFSTCAHIMSFKVKRMVIVLQVRKLTLRSWGGDTAWPAEPSLHSPLPEKSLCPVSILLTTGTHTICSVFSPSVCAGTFDHLSFSLKIHKMDICPKGPYQSYQNITSNWMQSIHCFLNDHLNNYNGPVGDRSDFTTLLLTTGTNQLRAHIQTQVHILHSSFEKTREASGLPDQFAVWV